MSILKRFRSAITGRYVSKKEAEESPATTVAETEKRATKRTWWGRKK